jgi:hypothetical protein
LLSLPLRAHQTPARIKMLKTINKPVTTPQFTPGREGLRRLAFALRNPQTWPKGFVWNFNACTQCAMGLACQLWLADETPVQREGESFHRQYVSLIARRLAIPFGDVERLFLTATWGETFSNHFFGLIWWRRELDFDKVTPEMVADAIDSYLVNSL